MFNTRSICNKTAGVFDLLQDSGTDICFLTETWLRKGDTSKIAEIKDFGFNVMHQSRAGRGGGVAIAFKKNIHITRNKALKYKSFEVLESALTSSASKPLRLTCIYRSCTAHVSNINEFPWGSINVPLNHDHYKYIIK